MFVTSDIAVPYDVNNEQDEQAAARMNTFNINWLVEPLLTGNWPQLMETAAGEVILFIF